MTQKFNITIVVDPAEGGIATGNGTYYFGEQVDLSITPAENYEFISWTENDVVVSQNLNYTFYVTENRNLVVHLSYLDAVGEHGSNTVVLYPNPVSDKLTVEATEAIDNIEIFNITGALVYSQKNCTDMVEIQTADLPAGTYVIRLTTQSATEVRRFVKK